MNFQAQRKRSAPVGIYSLALIFLLRSLVPAGFMPAALASGSPIQLCPQGLSPGVIAVLFDHHQQHHHAHHGHVPDQASQGEEFNCPLGLVLNPDVVSSAYIDFSLEKAPESLEVDPVVLFKTSRLKAFNSRAPPRRS